MYRPLDAMKPHNDHDNHAFESRSRFDSSRNKSCLPERQSQQPSVIATMDASSTSRMYGQEHDKNKPSKTKETMAVLPNKKVQPEYQTTGTGSYDDNMDQSFVMDPDVSVPSIYFHNIF